jgi:hypothetical protein
MKSPRERRDLEATGRLAQCKVGTITRACAGELVIPIEFVAAQPAFFAEQVAGPQKVRT